MNGTTLIPNDIEKEKRIINEIVLSSKDEFSDTLESFIETIKRCSSVDNSEIKNQLFSDICEHFLKILYRVNRFSEFKSKTRILMKGDKLSSKEFERCGFVIRLTSNDSVTILKNDFSDAIGSYKTARKKKTKTKKRK